MVVLCMYVRRDTGYYDHEMKDAGEMRVVSMEKCMTRRGQIGLDIPGELNFKIDAKEAVVYATWAWLLKAGRCRRDGRQNTGQERYGMGKGQ